MQSVAVLFGVWWIGAEVAWAGPAGGPDHGAAEVALCSADRLAEADAAVGHGGEVVVLSLDPFGRAAPGLPAGVTDYATAVRVYGDQIDAEPHPGPALAGRSADQVLDDCRAAAAAAGLTAADRVCSARDWDTASDLVANLLAVLASGASLVQVRNPDPVRQQRRRRIEKVTRVLP